MGWYGKLIGAVLGAIIGRGLLGAIVGFEIQVTEIQAKFKLSQNRPNEDQQRVALALSRSPDAMGRAVADLMPQHTRPKPS